jgi:hypothetical protein
VKTTEEHQALIIGTGARLVCWPSVLIPLAIRAGPSPHQWSLCVGVGTTLVLWMTLLSFTRFALRVMRKRVAVNSAQRASLLSEHTHWYDPVSGSHHRPGLSAPAPRITSNRDPSTRSIRCAQPVQRARFASLSAD